MRWRRSLVSRQPATKLPNKAAHARFFSHSPKSPTLVPKLQPSHRLLCSSCVLRGREGDDLQFNILPLLWVSSISTLVPRQSRLPQDVCSAWEAKNVSSPSLLSTWQTELRYHFSCSRLSDAINYITSQIRKGPQGLRRFVGLGRRWAVRSRTPNPYLGSGAAFGRARHGQSRNGTKCRSAPKERGKQREAEEGNRLGSQRVEAVEIGLKRGLLDRRERVSTPAQTSFCLSFLSRSVGRGRRA